MVLILESQQLRHSKHLPPCSSVYAGHSTPCDGVSVECVVDVVANSADGGPFTVGALTRTVKLSGKLPFFRRKFRTTLYSLVGNQCLVLGVLRATCAIASNIERLCKSPLSNQRKCSILPREIVKSLTQFGLLFQASNRRA